ncbi:hypothetical protein IMZ08_03390 [Bacillus luteolus]|uniref:Uncharacterized protein n=1 Tax=Litchfieldia luteola TaxID=682179 RepID=A0ABR9QF29_9BACI|nr:hypothetical protein [Cytobacillus luteolus]MBE4907101.1 hypothetical protein [Cytobacillus luteolus]MBP1943430.1 hypothetical protein [Cytobacillus luteolus]
MYSNITYSENVAASVAGDGEVDFKVLIDGVDVSTFGTPITITEGATTNKVTLTLSRALTPAEYGKTITIAPATDFDVADTNGNLQAGFTSFTVTK